MALFRDLVRTIAEVEGLSEMTVTGVGQYLRDAGKISKHGRGKAAAHMTVDDALALLIGVNASSLAKDAAEIVDLYSSLPMSEVIYEIYSDDDEDECDLLRHALHNPANAGSCISSLIRCCIPSNNGKALIEPQSPEVFITFYRPTPKIKISAYDYLSSDPEEQDEPISIIVFYSPNTRSPGDRTEEITITSATLCAIGSLLAQ